MVGQGLDPPDPPVPTVELVVVVVVPPPTLDVVFVVVCDAVELEEVAPPAELDVEVVDEALEVVSTVEPQWTAAISSVAPSASEGRRPEERSEKEK